MHGIKINGIYKCKYFDQLYVVVFVSDQKQVYVSWIGDNPHAAINPFGIPAMQNDKFVGIASDLLISLL